MIETARRLFDPESPFSAADLAEALKPLPPTGGPR